MIVIRVAAPATTANLGPGYDCLGMALDIWNTIEVETVGPELVEGPSGEAPSVTVAGEGAGELEEDTGNLVYRSMEFLFRELGRPMPPVRVRCDNEIPLARGLGSSAAAIAGGLAAANALVSRTNDGGEFSARDLLEMAATIEGHPDNVAAAVMGGLQLVVTEESTLYTVPVSVPAEIHAVVYIPDTRIATADARAVLPRELSVTDAVHNMSRVALLVAGMATNHPEYLSVATQDKLHQPYRQPLFPAMKLLMKAAMDAGALGAFLSGSGSTVLALTRGREMTVAYEMAEAARQAAVEGTVKVTQPTPLGAHLVS